MLWEQWIKKGTWIGKCMVWRENGGVLLIRTGVWFDFCRHFALLIYYIYLTHKEVWVLRCKTWIWHSLSKSLPHFFLRKSVGLCLLNCFLCGLSQGSILDLHFWVSGFIEKKCLMELMVIVPLKLGLYRQCIFLPLSANICFSFSLNSRVSFLEIWAGNRSSSLYNPKNLLMPGSCKGSMKWVWYKDTATT